MLSSIINITNTIIKTTLPLIQAQSTITVTYPFTTLIVKIDLVNIILLLRGE